VSTPAADVLIECLLEWNVDTVFGIPGDGINGIMEALCIRQDKIRFIQVRHEEGEQGLLRDMPMEPQVVA
jgi:pyruvate dehydrogenase (quinone)